MGMWTAALEIGRCRREAALRQSRALRYRSAMVASDRAIGRLEEANLRGAGRSVPDPVTQAAIDRALAALPAGAKAGVKPWVTVQQALDGMFDLQEALQAERRREQDMHGRNVDGHHGSPM